MQSPKLRAGRRSIAQPAVPPILCETGTAQFLQHCHGWCHPVSTVWRSSDTCGVPAGQTRTLLDRQSDKVASARSATLRNRLRELQQITLFASRRLQYLRRSVPGLDLVRVDSVKPLFGLTNVIGLARTFVSNVAQRITGMVVSLAAFLRDVEPSPTTNSSRENCATTFGARGRGDRASGIVMDL